MNLLIITYFIWFVFYSFVGWIWDTTMRSVEARKFYNSGFLAGPYCPIYGAGAVAIILLLGGIDNVFLLFIASATIATILEYVTSWVMEKMFHMRWWDYSKEFMNINGRVCLMGTVSFGVLGVVLIMLIQPAVASVTSLIPERLLPIIALALFTIILIDLVRTITKQSEFNAKLKQASKLAVKMRNEIQTKISDAQDDFIKQLNSYEKKLLRNFPKLSSTNYNDVLQKLKVQIRNKKK